MGKGALYRKIPAGAPNASAEDGPYANPVFHSVLRACFKTKRGRFTPFDIAVADVMTFCHVQGIDLQRFKDLEAAYDRCERLALQNVGEHVGMTLATDDEPAHTSAFVILPSTKPPARTTASKYVHPGSLPY